MIGKRIAKGLTIALFATLVTALLGFVVMRLWNWLTPTLFGWHLITFWQAIGILLLSKILFGGVRGGHGRHMRWRHRMKERWERMTPEQREKLQEGMRGRCGPFGPPAAQPKA
jgi:Ca2+/H+ antiporter, TMEM165/GDT1 family